VSYIDIYYVVYVCVYAGVGRSPTVSLSGGDVITDEDSSCSSRGGVRSASRVSRSESVDSIDDEDSQ